MIDLDKEINQIMRVDLNNNTANSELLGKQYEKLIEYISKSNESRASLNNFHNSIAAAVIGMVTFMYNFQIEARNKYFMIMVVCIAGLILCFTWSQELRRFYKSAQVLDVVVAKMESGLPSNPFESRTKLLGLLNAPSKTEKQELVLPWALSLVYSAMGLFMLYLIVIS